MKRNQHTSPEWVSARGLMLRMKNLFTACKKWRSWRQLKEEENWKSTQLPLKESRELVSCIYVYIRSSWWRLGSTFFRYLCARETTSTIRDCELELKGKWKCSSSLLHYDRVRSRSKHLKNTYACIAFRSHKHIMYGVHKRAR